MSKPFFFAMAMLHFGAAVALIYERNIPMMLCMLFWGAADLALMCAV